MNLIVFRHVDRDLQFSISSIPWDDWYKTAQMDMTPGVPQSTPEDAGKFLVVNQNGQPSFMRVDLGPEGFVMKSLVVPGNHGSPTANMNSMKKPFVVKDGEMWTIFDEESEQTYLWAGGSGTFGYGAGATPVDPGMFSVLKPAISDLMYATDKEAAAGDIEAKAINPHNAGFLDIDGGSY